MLVRRKLLMTGLAGLPLAAVLADPRLAALAAEGTEPVSITTKGGQNVSAAIALPAKTPAPAVLLIHEWWGLNDQIKTMAVEFAKEGYVALAVDLYGGAAAATPEEAQALMQSVDPSKATDALVSWIGWLRDNQAVNGKVATVGWCFGGGWAIDGPIAAPVEATVIYYGRLPQGAAEVRPVTGPVLGHFGEQDKFINHDMVAGFEKAMKEAGKPLTVYWYDANHAFANPTGANYNKADAQVAWSRTLEFLEAGARLTAGVRARRQVPVALCSASTGSSPSGAGRPPRRAAVARLLHHRVEVGLGAEAEQHRIRGRMLARSSGCGRDACDGLLGGADQLGDLAVAQLRVVAHQPGDGVRLVLPLGDRRVARALGAGLRHGGC